MFFYKQQTMQVTLLMGALEEAYRQIEILERALGVAQKCSEEKVEEEEEEEVVKEHSSRKTLMVMDSHVKNLNPLMIEEELLFTGQFSCERRAYNSGEWPAAKFPHQNLKTVLPKILREREYSDPSSQL